MIPTRLFSRALIGVVMLLMLLPALAIGAPTGQIDSIGFQNIYRPGCWTPMLVTIQPDAATGSFKLQVVQNDLDRDHVVYTRAISLAGGAAPREFWAYFIPQATDGGLPDPTEGLAALSSKLKVYLADARGEPIVQLPVTQTISSIGQVNLSASTQRGRKMILTVADAATGDAPPRIDYSQVIGIKEEALLVPLAPADLPDNAIGYQGVDAIMMFDVNPAELKTSGKLQAIRHWVREGGNLLICQNPMWQKMAGWGDLLPVSYPEFSAGSQLMQGSAESLSPGPIIGWTNAGHSSTARERTSAPFRLGVARATDGAVVADEIDWPAPNHSSIHTPYLVRKTYGLGTVSWIALDLGRPNIARFSTGWPRILDHIFGWKNDPFTLSTATNAREQTLMRVEDDAYGITHGIDFGAALLAGMEHPGRSASLLAIAFCFFLVYWALAGPVSFGVLVWKRQTRQSWLIFAALAVVATGLTYVLIKLVLGGPADIRHASIVRVTADQPAVVRSRVGLYVPHDNPAEPISLPGCHGDSTIIPYPVDPRQFKANSFAGYMRYQVPVRDDADPAPPLIRVPFRSTLKKLKINCIDPQPGIEGSASLLSPAAGIIHGELTNAADVDLHDVYLVFHYPGNGPDAGDWALYVAQWNKGQSINLKQQFAISPPPHMSAEPIAVPGVSPMLKARIGGVGRPGRWEQFWFTGLRGGAVEQPYSSDPYRAFVICSLFERLPTPRNTALDPDRRFEMLRRGMRQADVSNVLMSGSMVALAHANGPLPFDLTVGDRRVKGQGSVYYQFIIPLESLELNH